MKDKFFIILGAITILVLPWLAYCGLHGWWRDVVTDEGLHDDCIPCDTYRIMHADDAAFAQRETRRAQR